MQTCIDGDCVLSLHRQRKLDVLQSSNLMVTDVGNFSMKEA